MKSIFKAEILLLLPLAVLASNPTLMPNYSNIPSHYYYSYMVPQDCSPIKEFYYDRPFVFGPPYLVAEEFSEGEQTLLIACESNNSENEFPYRILVFSRKYNYDPFAKYEEYSACPSQIPLKFKTGGLGVVEKSTTTLKESMDSTFYPARYNDEDEFWSGKIIIEERAMLIRNEHSGGSSDFICIDGSWYYRVIH